MINTFPPAGLMDQISSDAYQEICDFVYTEAGIDLGPSRQMLVLSRLQKRLPYCNAVSFDDYVGILKDPKNELERQTAIELLSTNQTYFFREPEHFKILKTLAPATYRRPGPLRVWSAASSSGEEAYSIAMELEHSCDNRFQWQVFGSDIHSQMICQAQRGLYPMQRIDSIPESLRKSCCLKGTGTYEGFFLIDAVLRRRTHFAVINLVRPLPETGQFDAIFFRNALIYFDNSTRQAIVHRLLSRLYRGGILVIGLSESLKRMGFPLQLIAPTTYRKL